MIENIQYYPLSKCFRCPYHCNLLKIINEKANKKYNRDEIQAFFPKIRINQCILCTGISQTMLMLKTPLKF